MAKLSGIKLIMSLREINLPIASMAARVVQLTIIDTLYVNRALKNSGKGSHSHKPAETPVNIKIIRVISY
jgi:hypothetical protein